MCARKSKPPFPSKSELLEYIQSQDRPISRRDIAQAYQIKGAERIPMKALLKELVIEGAIESQGGGYGKAEARETMMVELVDTDEDGDYIAKPVQWKEAGDPPKVYVFTPRYMKGRRAPDLRVGDRVLVSVKVLSRSTLEGKFIRKFEKHATTRVIGEFTASKYGGVIVPTDRKLPAKFNVQKAHVGDAKTGDLVMGNAEPSHGSGFPNASITEILGQASDPKMFSLISELEHELPNQFSDEAIQLANKAQLPSLKGREDLRDIPLVTIDGEDARDFDDAVWAHTDGEDWDVIVAIADVSYYVRPNDALDREALKRGNSVYFPERAIPMLPEALSNEMCSLKPNVDRACIAVRMSIDGKGNVKKFKFMRGLMRSVARLTYTQVQEAIDGKTTELKPAFINDILKPLYGVYGALKKARERRHTIELDLPERKVVFDKDGHLDKVVPRERYHSHMLIEELMIAANVCAAVALEERQRPCMYRVHERPDPLKVASLGNVLQNIGYPRLKSLDISQASVNNMLKAAKGHEDEDLVNMLVLRTMAQANYRPHNLGHYGLNLQRYCHFTSPIRRYSDLLVHRSLVDAFKLGEGGLAPTDFEAVGIAISATERRAMLAERGAMDRYMAAYMDKEHGEVFEGKIVSISQFGLFVMIEPVGATGFLPLRSIEDDYYSYNDRTKELFGRKTRNIFRLGQAIKVGINRVRVVSGSIELTYINLGKDKKRRKVK